MLSRPHAKRSGFGGISHVIRVLSWHPNYQNSRLSTTTRTLHADEAEVAAARKWLTELGPDTFPRNLYEISFSRSSGPGGQNVNKVSSKATLRVPIAALLARVPRLLHDPIIASRYHASRSQELVIQADDSRKANDNALSCHSKLMALIEQAGREVIPGETSPEQMQRVKQLQKQEAAGRRRIKEHQSSKKSARRGGGGRDD